MSTTDTPSTDGTGLTIEEAQHQYREIGSDVMGIKQSSVDTYCHGVDTFADFAAEHGIITVGEIDAKVLARYRSWLADRYDNASTLGHYGKGVRQWLKYLGEVGDVPADLHKRLRPHRVPPEERRSESKIPVERLDKIVDYMDTHFPCHRDTILLKVTSMVGPRITDIRAIDVTDVQINVDGQPIIKVRDRPETGTGLKRGKTHEHNHERNVPITKELFDQIKVYVKEHRNDVTDDFGREPLFASRRGRLSKSSMRETAYKWSCGQHNGLQDCDCTERRQKSQCSKCSLSVGMHAIRAAAITRLRNKGATWEDISQVVGAKPAVLQQHYDRSSMAEQSARGRRAIEVLEV